MFDKHLRAPGWRQELRRILLAFILGGASALSAAAAQRQTPVADAPRVTPAAGGAALALIEPPAPMAPAVINRDVKGRATVRAIRIASPLRIDGHLDESVYLTVPGAGEFVQQVPREGVPATEQTQMWVLFDDKNLYLAARCDDSHAELEIATELRRDDNGLVQNESLSIALDTFYDRRNGFFFQTGPLGTLRDQSIVDDQFNESWNTVWEVKSARSERGWTMEMSIPFKSLRYMGSGPQVWGINARRIVKWKNENSYLSAVPAAYGTGAINRMGAGGTLVGLETPLQAKNLELKPYAASSLNTDKAATVPFTNDLTSNVGFDFKYGLTRGLIADVTVNTDFAQVEEDLQQVNLTRFSLQFPEKREFFLEGQGIFSFGGVFGNAANSGTNREVPILFFSRRIGLSNGLTVPVQAGGRLSGRAGAYSIGALDIRTGDKPSANAVATNFSVLRLKRNVLRRSAIGMIATRRTPTIDGGGSSVAGGVDANFGFFENVGLDGFYANTSSGRGAGGAASYRGTFEYGGDRYGFKAEHLLIGPRFNPEVGYVRRTDFRRSYANARFSPRMKKSRLIRKLSWQGTMDYVENAARTGVQNREAKGVFGIEFNAGDSLSADIGDGYELVPRQFVIASGVIVPAGGYSYRTLHGSYTVGQQRIVSGQVAASHGSFYGGTKTDASYSGYMALSPHFALEPTVTLAWVDLPYGAFTARVFTNRTIITPTARMMITSLVQFNAGIHSLTASARLRWEYQPGSELFVVYSDGRTTLSRGAPELLNRSFAVKITRLLRF